MKSRDKDGGSQQTLFCLSLFANCRCDLEFLKYFSQTKRKKKFFKQLALGACLKAHVSQIFNHISPRKLVLYMPFLASQARFEDLIGQSLTVYISPFVPISLFKLINVCTLNWSVYSSCEFITRNQTKKVYSTLTANLFHCSFRRVVFLNTLTNKGQKVRLGQYFNI